MKFLFSEIVDSRDLLYQMWLFVATGYQELFIPRLRIRRIADQFHGTVTSVSIICSKHYTTQYALLLRCFSKGKGVIR